MTDEQIQFVEQCIRDDNVHRFYCRKEWKKIKADVLKLDKYECQKCKAKGKYTRAILVHHVNHLRDYPSLALEIYDPNGKRNLISLCQDCHEQEHLNERPRFKTKKENYMNKEKW